MVDSWGSPLVTSLKLQPTSHLQNQPPNPTRLPPIEQHTHLDHNHILQKTLLNPTEAYGFIKLSSNAFILQIEKPWLTNDEEWEEYA